MLEFNLDHIFKLRGIKRKYSFLKKLGLSHDVSTRMANNKLGSLRLEHATKICKVLNCTPNDLLDFSGGEDLPSEHSLLTLKKDQTLVESIEKVQKLPLSKLDELKTWLDQQV